MQGGAGGCPRTGLIRDTRQAGLGPAAATEPPRSTWATAPRPPRPPQEQSPLRRNHRGPFTLHRDSREAVNECLSGREEIPEILSGQCWAAHRFSVALRAVQPHSGGGAGGASPQTWSSWGGSRTPAAWCPSDPPGLPLRSLHHPCKSGEASTTDALHAWGPHSPREGTWPARGSARCLSPGTRSAQVHLSASSSRPVEGTSPTETPSGVGAEALRPG